MKNKISKSILILLLLTSNIVSAQSGSSDLKKYVVFTFEVTHKNGNSKETYYWITLQDAITKNNAFEVFPLYTAEYSKDALDRCKAGDPIDIFTASTATNFNFDDDYQSQVKHLLTLINSNKIKVQEFRKKWTQNGDEVRVNVYACPVIGVFCSCLQSHGKPTYGFKGTVYLPVMSFSHDEGFWKSKSEKIVKHVDYSYVEYSVHQPSYMHGNANIRVKGSMELF